MADELYAGLMSGTSMDGIDAVLVAFEGSGCRCLATHFEPYDDPLRNGALSLQDADGNELHRAAMLANTLAGRYGDAILRLLAAAGVEPRAVRAIGCHGQTIRHAPERGYTIQLNNPALLAERTGIAVVADFRSRDVAAGGQGAPLVPAFHDALFRSPDHHRIILNLGGIANVTDLPPGGPTRGFDCGPANMLLDAWARRHLGQPCDRDGAFARQGRVLEELLERLLTHPYLSLMPPKSCGREQFNLPWLETQLDGSETAADVQATLTAFAAAATVEAIRLWCGLPDEVFVCGGGADNGALMAALAEHLPDCRLESTAALGLAPDWVEATAFAWLARRALRGEPGNLPAVTGACGPRILGAIYPA